MVVRMDGYRGVKFNLRVPVQVACKGGSETEGRLDPTNEGTVQAVGIVSDTPCDPSPIYTVR